jgi:hypothetical protein
MAESTPPARGRGPRSGGRNRQRRPRAAAPDSAATGAKSSTSTAGHTASSGASPERPQPGGHGQTIHGPAAHGQAAHGQTGADAKSPARKGRGTPHRKGKGRKPGKPRRARGKAAQPPCAPCRRDRSGQGRSRHPDGRTACNRARRRRGALPAAVTATGEQPGRSQPGLALCRASGIALCRSTVRPMPRSIWAPTIAVC